MSVPFDCKIFPFKCRTSERREAANRGCFCYAASVCHSAGIKMSSTHGMRIYLRCGLLAAVSARVHVFCVFCRACIHYAKLLNLFALCCRTHQVCMRAFFAFGCCIYLSAWRGRRIARDLGTSASSNIDAVRSRKQHCESLRECPDKQALAHTERESVDSRHADGRPHNSNTEPPCTPHAHTHTRTNTGQHKHSQRNIHTQKNKSCLPLSCWAHTHHPGWR